MARSGFAGAENLAVSHALGFGHWRFLGVLFSRFAGGRSGEGPAGRQAKRRLGGDLCRDLSRREAGVERLVGDFLGWPPRPRSWAERLTPGSQFSLGST